MLEDLQVLRVRIVVQIVLQFLQNRHKLFNFVMLMMNEKYRSDGIVVQHFEKYAQSCCGQVGAFDFAQQETRGRELDEIEG